MKLNLPKSITILSLVAALPCLAAHINLNDYSLTPDGSATVGLQNTNINIPNGGTVLPASGTPVVYVVSTFTFGTASDAHLQFQFFVNETSAPRLGVEIQDTGLVQFLGTGDTTQTNFNFNQDMAGQTVTLLAKLSYDANNNVTYGKAGASDDTIMNVWINPTGSSVEGSGLTAGDMSTIWNSAGFNWFRQIIQNQNTPGTSGDSSITDTMILTGANATFANALALAMGGTPPPPGTVDVNISTVVESPTFVPADGATTSTITVTLLDSLGDPVTNKDVTLANTAGPQAAVIDPLSAVTTDINGQATFTVSSSTAGTEEFTATNTTDTQIITQTASVTFVDAADAALSTVVASPSYVNADGTTTSTVTVTLLAAGGIPTPDKEVTLAGSPGTATINPPGSQTTDVNGQVTFAVSSGTPGQVVFTATVVTDSVVVTQTASVDFAGAAAAGTSTVTASADSAVADGTSASTITVSLKDSAGIPVEGEEVTLADFPATATIDPAGSQFTDVNGQVTFDVSSTNAGVVEFTATAVGAAVVLTDTASVEFLDSTVPLSFNVSFERFTGGGIATPDESTLVGPAGGLGDSWNQFAFPDSNDVVVASNGAVTSVFIDTNFSEGRGGASGDQPVYHASLTDFNKGLQNKVLTISGLPANAHYDVWIMAYRDNTSAAERLGAYWSTGNPTSSPATQTLSSYVTRNGTTFEDGVNFVLFESVVVDGSGVIAFDADAFSTINGDPADLRSGLSGFQLAPASGTATFYQNWSGGEPFDGDANGDGVNNGLAFLLGATDPDANALGLLPAVNEDAGGLVLTFSMLNASARGNAVLNVEHSSDLGIGDPWTAVAVPENTGSVGGVSFDVTPGDPLNSVIATIPSSEAAAGKLFGRLKGTEN